MHIATADTQRERIKRRRQRGGGNTYEGKRKRRCMDGVGQLNTVSLNRPSTQKAAEDARSRGGKGRGENNQ